MAKDTLKEPENSVSPLQEENPSSSYQYEIPWSSLQEAAEVPPNRQAYSPDDRQRKTEKRVVVQALQDAKQLGTKVAAQTLQDAKQLGTRVTGQTFLDAKQLKSYKQQSEVDNKNKNQDLARHLALCLAIGFAALCVGSFAGSLLKVEFAKEIFEKSFSPLTCAFFTVLGFLFGDRNANKEE